jgi:hypothetical protein
MVGDSKLDMSLDALIKKQKQQKPVGAKAKLQQKQKGKPGSQQKQQAGAGGGAKGKPMPQQQARKGVPLKAKGGVGKPSIPQRAGPGKVSQSMLLNVMIRDTSDLLVLCCLLLFQHRARSTT